MCVVRLDDDTLIRRIRTERSAEGRMKVWLEADNESQPPVDVSGRLGVKLLGIVLYLVERHV
jgi:hypothetical protein